MFGVLEVILSGDPVAGQRFGVSQRQVTFVVPSWVLRNVRALVASHCGFGPSELGFLRFHVARHSPVCTWCAAARLRCDSVFMPVIVVAPLRRTALA